MPILLLVIIGVVSALGAWGVLLLQQYQINKGSLVLEENYNGPALVSATLHVLIRRLLKRSVYVRKFFVQYGLHMMVRGMHYIDVWSTYLYSKSRNWFVENAVRNRGTVPHFWEHLKVYKQEIDKEKDEDQ